jgi:hypothetical protein
MDACATGSSRSDCHDPPAILRANGLIQSAHEHLFRAQIEPQRAHVADVAGTVTRSLHYRA